MCKKFALRHKKSVDLDRLPIPAGQIARENRAARRRYTEETVRGLLLSWVKVRVMQSLSVTEAAPQTRSLPVSRRIFSTACRATPFAG